MQTQLPFFPESTRLINLTLGVREQEGYIYYLHNGNPIYCHAKQDINSYRFILGNLVVNNLCTIGELSKTLGIARRNIERYAKTYREKGAEYFFARKETRGRCYKITEELIPELQQRLDESWSYYRIAKEYEISESAVRYHINKGTLKKK
ncbi:MAG: hypothetical protein M0P69_20145 [Bacteroidales bacterium]|jgi:transposase|nr:hypothetical protein [Bacteroidales bacterium]